MRRAKAMNPKPCKHLARAGGARKPPGSMNSRQMALFGVAQQRHETLVHVELVVAMEQSGAWV